MMRFPAWCPARMEVGSKGPSTRDTPAETWIRKTRDSLHLPGPPSWRVSMSLQSGLEFKSFWGWAEIWLLLTHWRDHSNEPLSASVVTAPCMRTFWVDLLSGTLFNWQRQLWAVMRKPWTCLTGGKVALEVSWKWDLKRDCHSLSAWWMVSSLVWYSRTLKPF